MSAASRACASCGTDQNVNKRCSRCKSVWYCSADHQKQHWKTHKKACGTAVKAPSSSGGGGNPVATARPPVLGAVADATPLYAVTGAQEAGVDIELPQGSAQVVSKRVAPTPELDENKGLTPDQEAMLAKILAERRKAPAETLVECPHQAALGTDEPCVECQAKAYNLAKSQYEAAKAEYGLADDRTLDLAMQFFSQLIAQYKLTECDDLLSACYEVVKGRREDKIYIQVIQALAFLRFKQFKFADAVKLFEEMRTLVGPSERLLENLGHAYNSLGNYPKAEEALNEALKMINALPSAQLEISNKGGVLLGLGLVKHHQMRTEEGLPLLIDALNWYRSKHPGDHSLVAKAHSSVGDALDALNRLVEADYHLREAVRIFRITCGDDSPLTAKALAKLGNLLVRRNKPAEAHGVLFESLQSSVHVDVHSVHLSTIVQLLLALGNVSPSDDKSSLLDMAPKVAPLCRIAYEKLKLRGGLHDDGDTAVFFKVYAEQLMLSGSWIEGQPIIHEACRILGVLHEPEAQNLLDTCKILKQVCDNKVATLSGNVTDSKKAAK